VHSILSGNLMDVCPVGAITTRDYRFKSRPWDNPLVADTICTQCEKGCNVSAWVKAKPEWAKGSRLVRLLSWAQSPYIKRSNIAICLLCDRLSAATRPSGP
jgi:ferredoxin